LTSYRVVHLLVVQPLIFRVLPLLYLLVLEVGHRQDVLEEVIEQDEGIELEVGVVAVVALERLSHALDDQLGDVEAIVADQVHLHQLGFDSRL
jgi:hypothetical protein